MSIPVLQSQKYILLTESFKKWLGILGYAETTVYDSTNYIRDFFFYMEKQGIFDITGITKQHINEYHSHLQTRKHKRKIGSLSQNYITSNINALKRLSKYLQETGKPLLEIDIQTSRDKEDNKTILTREEIKKLYNACDKTVYGQRDKAILNLYYGCGLRRSEGTGLDIKDIKLNENLVYVRKSKNYRERYVPMTDQIKNDMHFYINHTRVHLCPYINNTNKALLISYRGKRLHGNSIMLRLKKLAEAAKTNKEIGLHTLRHSIATHLLQSGMSLEDVSRFLGHTSLESTQIYTHLTSEILTKEEQEND